MGDRDWLASWVARSGFVPRVTIHCHGRAGGCFPPLGRLVRSRGLGLGHLRGARSGGWARPSGSAAGAGSMGSARAALDRTSLGALDLLRLLCLVQLGPQKRPFPFPPMRRLLGAPTCALPGVGAVGTGPRTGNLCLFFHRRPVSGSLRKGGEATWGLPASGSRSAQSLGSLRVVGVGRSTERGGHMWVLVGEASRDFRWGTNFCPTCPHGMQAPALLRSVSPVPRPPFLFFLTALR